MPDEEKENIELKAPPEEEEVVAVEEPKEETEIVEPDESSEDEIEIVEPEKTKAKKKEKKEETVEEAAEQVPEEEVYKVKPKPELGADEKHALSLRAVKRGKKPNFRRQEWFRYVRVGESWRKPRGLHSKTRRNYRYRAPKVSKGYRGPKTVRGRHPSGFEDVLIHSPKDLEGLDPKKQAARIGHTVGTRKRIAIKEKADELGIRILNWGGS